MKKLLLIIAIYFIGVSAIAQAPINAQQGATGGTGMLQKYPNGTLGTTGHYTDDPVGPTGISGKRDNYLSGPSGSPERKTDPLPGTTGVSGPTGKQKPKTIK